MSKDELMACRSGPLLFGALITVEQCLGNCGGSLSTMRFVQLFPKVVFESKCCIPLLFLDFTLSSLVQ